MNNAPAASLNAVSGRSRGCMQQRDIHQYIQTVRLQLLDVSRVSQRAVDYSIKSYLWDSPELCAIVREGTYEVTILHGEINEIARDLLLMELPLESDVRFALSAVLICDALISVHAQAVKIAANSERIWENGRVLGCAALTRMGDEVNRLMRLCIIALFDEEVDHAETVLRNRGVERFFESEFYDWYRNIDQRLRTQACYELAIARSLSQMAKELYEIADAIVFSLRDLESGATSNIDLRQPTTRGPEGAQAFFEEMDTCLADPCFWSRL